MKKMSLGLCLLLVFMVSGLKAQEPPVSVAEVMALQNSVKSVWDDIQFNGSWVRHSKYTFENEDAVKKASEAYDVLNEAARKTLGARSSAALAELHLIFSNPVSAKQHYDAGLSLYLKAEQDYANAMMIFSMAQQLESP